MALSFLQFERHKKNDPQYLRITPITGACRSIPIFYRVTEISQIFQNDSETQKRGLQGGKTQQFPGIALLRMFLEAWAFDACCFGNQLPSISPRSAPVSVRF